MINFLKNKIKPDLILWLGFFLILFGHLFYEYLYPQAFNYLYYFYHVKPQIQLGESPFTTLWYSHHQPPLFFGIFLLYNAFLSYSLIPFKILSLIMHFLSWKWLIDSSKKLNFNKYYLIFMLLVVANPSSIFLFRQIGYTPFLFFISSLLIKILTSEQSLHKKFIYYSIILVILSLSRASYQYYIVILLMIPWFFILKKREFFKGFLIAVLPVLGWSIKNFILYGFLGTSSWYGLNIAGHINTLDCGCLNEIKRIDKIHKYDHCFDSEDLLVQKYASIPSLHQNNMQDVRIIRISKAFTQELKECFNPKISILTVFYGFFSFYSSPLIDGFYEIQEHWFQFQDFSVIDWFDLPNISILKNKDGVGSWLRFSWFTFIYPLALIFLIFNYKKLDTLLILALFFTFIMSALYISVDPNESARMRFEIEPFYLILVGIGVNLICNYKSKI